MKKTLILLVVVSCMVLATAMVASATTQAVTGSGSIGSSSANSSLSVTTSSNVTINYGGAAQSYGASAKHKAGDKVYATGGGQGAASGIYFEQNNAWVGVVNSTDPGTLFTAGSSWTAQ